MNFFHHKDLGNHLLQLCPKVVKHPVYIYINHYLETGKNSAHSPRIVVMCFTITIALTMTIH